MPLSPYFSIADLEALTGIKAHTLRTWEKRYQLFAPHRSDGNARRYNQQDLLRLLNIRNLIQQGHKISSIAEWSEEEIRTRVREAHLFLGEEADQTGEQLLLALCDLREELIQKILQQVILKMGFEQAIIQVIFPFFRRLGQWWEAGVINPAQEHFFSQIIRQKLLTAIDSLPIPQETSKPKIILFLPDRELHELGLLFYQYALRQRGYPTLYLGPAVPMTDLNKMITISRAKVLLGVLSYSLGLETVLPAIRQLSEEFSIHILLTGRAVAEIPLKDKSPVLSIFSNLQDLLEILSSLETK